MIQTERNLSFIPSICRQCLYILPYPASAMCHSSFRPKAIELRLPLPSKLRQPQGQLRVCHELRENWSEI